MTFEQFLNTTFVENEGATEEGMWLSKHIAALQEGLRQLLKLSGHSDVDTAADGTATNDLVLYKAANSNKWTVKKLSEVKPTMDERPTQGSTNPVESGGLYLSLRALETALANCASATDVTAALRRISAIEQQLEEGVGARTLGELENVDDEVDEESTGTQVLVQQNGQWGKQNVANLIDLSGKFGHAEYQNGSILFYDEENGNVIQTLHLTGDIYNINMGYTGSSVFSVLTGDTEKILTIAPSTTLQTSIGGEAVPVTESYNYVVAVNSGSGYVNRLAGENQTGSISFDIRPFLVVGTNTVRITVTGNTSQATRSLVLTATLTSLSLSCLHNWRTPWNEGAAYTIGNIYFSGAIQKTLHVGVDGVELTELQQTFQPSENASTIAKSVTIPATDFPEIAISGQHYVEVWMTGTGVETQHIRFNILCVLTGDTTPLVCVNNIAERVMNYATNTLFDYYVLNANMVQVVVGATIGTIRTEVANQMATGLEDGVLNTFATQFEVATESKDPGTVDVTVYPYQDETLGETVLLPTLVLDNSLVFAAISGAVFYWSAGTRSNAETNRESIVNVATDPAESYPGVWHDMTWNTDGWATDAEGHKALALLAGTSAEFAALQPFSFADPTNGLTIEMMIRASVVADLNTPILKFIDTAPGSTGDNVTVGCTIYPTKIQVLGSREQEELKQEVGLSEDTITHLVITLQKNYAGTGKNLCTIYVNAVPNVTFEFSPNSTFGAGSLQVGQDSTDVYLYMMRIYDRALEGTEVLTNFENAIFNGVEFDRETVREKNDILTDSIQYALVRDKFNCFIVEPDDETQDVPGFFNQATVMSTVRFEYAEHHDWDVMIKHVPVDGQGTTSKKYFRWNLRGKFASNCEWYYTDGDGRTRGNYKDTAKFTNKKGFMDGGEEGGVHLKIDRFTAKKNIASSPQGHKMGATALYDELFTQLGLKAELPNANFRVAVWQYPFIGFRKLKNSETYEFIGLYTAGPDKGCKSTFGYSDDYPVAMCIEGPNHAPRGTRFLHPWVDIEYSSADETLKFGGQEGWDDDYSSVGSSDKAADAPAIRACYESEWRPAYDLVFHCSPYIAKLTEATMDGVAMGATDAAALAAINANVGAFMANGQTTRGEKNELMSFYDANYDIYYYRNSTKQFEKLVREDGDAEDGLWNIKTYLGLTGSPTTDEIVAARAAKFKREMGNYFSLQQTLYHKCYCMLIGAKDNDAKNSYPFKHLALAEGGRWGWKQDDLDSIFDTDNNGQATVKYSAEHGDLSEGAEIFQGCDSAFWTLIWRYYQQELGTMMLSMMNGLKTIAQEKNLVSGSGLHLHDYVFAALSYYFFDQSAKYFPQIAYYHDRTFGYLDPWQVAGQTAPDGSIYPATYNNVYPLAQALGDRYQDERLWIYRRIAYIFSKYGIGAFSGVGDGWGQIAFTLSRQYTFSLVPAIDLYPVGSVGGDAVRAARTRAGQVAALTIAASQGTGNYINGADWLSSLGDLHDMVLLNRTGGTDKPFTVAAQRMEVLKVGDAELPVTFNATSLEVTGPAFKVIDAQRVTTIAQEVDLRQCPRLRRALFGGCSAPGLLLPVGSRVSEVSFPDNLLELFLHSLNQLEAANMTIDAGTLPKIQTFYFNKCAQLNPLAILASIIVTGGRLTYVSMVWDGTIAATSDEWQALVELAQDENTVPKYRNVTYDPSAKLVNDNDHRASVTGAISVGTIGKKDYDLVVAAFPGLTIAAERIVDYLTFEDSRVWEICCYNWGDTRLVAPGNAFATGEIEADGSALVVCDHVFASCLVHPKRTMSDGTSPAQVAAAARTFEVELQFDSATPFSSIAAGATVIEIRQYASNTSTQVVVGTLAKEDVVLDGDNKLTITTSGTTNACQYLTVAVLANNGVKATYTVKVASTSASGIYQPVGITREQCAAVSSLGNNLRYCIGSSFNEFKFFTNITNLNTYDFYDYGYIEELTIPPSVTNIGRPLSYCYGLRYVIFLSDVPPTITNSMCNQQERIYVPDESLEQYKAAANWSALASRIRPISEFDGKITIYDNIILESSINNSGVEGTTPYECTTKLIPVNGGDSITWSIAYASFGRNMNYYKSDGAWLDYNAPGSPERTVNVPSAARYIRAEFRTKLLDDCYIYNNTTGEYLFKGVNVP